MGRQPYMLRSQERRRLSKFWWRSCCCEFPFCFFRPIPVISLHVIFSSREGAKERQLAIIKHQVWMLTVTHFHLCRRSQGGWLALHGLTLAHLLLVRGICDTSEGDRAELHEGQATLRTQASPSVLQCSSSHLLHLVVLRGKRRGVSGWCWRTAVRKNTSVLQLLCNYKLWQ